MDILNQKLTLPKIDYYKFFRYINKTIHTLKKYAIIGLEYWMSIDFKELFRLLWINFKTSIRNTTDYIKVITFYYPNWKFLKADLGIILTYFFDNPFTISKRFLRHKGEKDIYQYGETPLTTLHHIMKECNVTAKDTIIDLGCGRGRTCFWLSQVLDANTIGVEQIPEFVERASRITHKRKLQKVSFRNQDILQTNLAGATVIYLYGSTYSDTFIKKLAEKLSHLPSGTKIITISYPLTDYTDKPIFEVMKRFPAQFTWGEADVYLQLRK